MPDADHFRKLAAQYRALAEKADQTTNETLMRLVRAYEHEAERRDAGDTSAAPIGK